MGKKSERIAKLEREVAAHDEQRRILHEESLHLQKTVQGLRYSEGLLKRARHEINKRGARVNKLRKEVKELVGAVQHLARENVELTAQLSDALRRNIERSITGRGLNKCGAPLYPSMVECCTPDEALGRAFIAHREYLKKTDCSLSMYQLKERYKGLRGCSANDKRYQFRKSFQAARKFSQHVVRESLVLAKLAG